MGYQFVVHWLSSPVRKMWPGETLSSFMQCSFSVPRCYSAFTKHVNPRHLGTCFLAAIFLTYKYCRRISSFPLTMPHMHFMLVPLSPGVGESKSEQQLPVNSTSMKGFNFWNCQQLRKDYEIKNGVRKQDSAVVKSWAIWVQQTGETPRSESTKGLGPSRLKRWNLVETLLNQCRSHVTDV